MGKMEILQGWLNKGEEELRSAEYLSTMHHPTPDETICYLCQQSAEKYLKGFLFLCDIEPPKTHDLIELITMCLPYNNNFSVLMPKAQVLTNYGVMPRYPNELHITGDDARVALQYARDIKDYVLAAVERV
jgi:HEPN domain-containing protein